MNTSEIPMTAVVEGQRRLIVVSAAIAFLAWFADFLFWHVAAGLSVGLFFATLGLMLFFIGRRSSTAILSLFLLLTSALQSGIELSFSNTTCLLLLTVVLFGETAFPSISHRWSRWSEALYAILSGFMRWNDFIAACANTRVATAARERMGGAAVGRALTATIQAGVLVVVFAILLASGNAVLAEIFTRIATHLKAWLLDFTVLRTISWLLWLTIGIAFFWPAPTPRPERWWTRAIPIWNRKDVIIAKWQGALLLTTVNGLFFLANTTDALYLWSSKALPNGVNHSQFVHEGVHSLIGAVLLSAFVLALLFQQQPAIARWRGLRLLAFAWIAQNLILILGVLRRLQLYVEAYQLSELRVYVACFLVLVTVGFLFLARHVWNGMKLGHLLLENAVSTFVLLCVLQFCDVGTWVALWNVRHWERSPNSTLDLGYLAALGPRGWPALAQAATSRRDAETAVQARSQLINAAVRLKNETSDRNWRSYQWRRDTRADEMIRLWSVPQ